MRRRFAATAAAITLTAALTACGLGSEAVNTTPKNTGSKPAAGAGKTKPSAKAKPKRAASVGDTLTLHGVEDGEQLDVTLLKWEDDATSADEFLQPQAGKRWVAAQFQLVNTGSKVYSDSPANGAQVADAEGQRFQSTFGAITAGPEMSSDATLPPGDKALGWIAFEAPKDSKIAKVQFAMASGFAEETGQWTVK